MDFSAFCVPQAFHQIIFVIGIHQKSDRATVHTINWQLIVLGRMQRLQHKAIPAKGHNDICLFKPVLTIALHQGVKPILRNLCRAGSKGNMFEHVLNDTLITLTYA